MRFHVGDDYRDDDADYRTFGIDDHRTGHYNKIEVYGDESLRNRIIDLLNKSEVSEESEKEEA